MIVIQCWDDGTTGDIRLAEMLRKYNAKACFNLNAGAHEQEKTYKSWRWKDTYDVWRLGRSDLKHVYRGFDIANHTIHHHDTNKLSPEELKNEIDGGKKMLEDFFGFEVRGFVYPCGVYNDQVKNIVKASGHLYARTTKNTDKVFPPADPMEFHSSCHFTHADFKEKFEKAKADNGVFYFWGHTFEIISEEIWYDLEEKISMIAADSSVTWKFPADLFDKKLAGK